MVPLENAEGLYLVEPVNHATPETLFERRWALTVVDGLLADLRAQWCWLSGNSAIPLIDLLGFRR